MICAICDKNEATLDKWCEPCIRNLLNIRIKERMPEILRELGVKK